MWIQSIAKQNTITFNLSHKTIDTVRNFFSITLVGPDCQAAVVPNFNSI